MPIFPQAAQKISVQVLKLLKGYVGGVGVLDNVSKCVFTVTNSNCRGQNLSLILQNGKLEGEEIMDFSQQLLSFSSCSWQPSCSAKWTAINPYPEPNLRSGHNGNPASIATCTGHAECQPCY